MPVLMTADVPGQSQADYDGMLAALGQAIQESKGFIAHFGAPSKNGWTCMELWETEDDANQFFAKFVHPNLPEGIKPKRSFVPLHSLIRV